MDTTLIVEGMTCGGCEKSVRNAILQTQAVADVQIDRPNNQAKITFKPGLTDDALRSAALREMIASVEAAGFDCRQA